MTYKEKTGDLFKEQDVYLAHCVSSDFALGAGIAKTFRDRGVKGYLINHYFKSWNGNGYALYAPMEGSKGVYNLVTKHRYDDKPTLDTVREALCSMKEQLPNDAKVAMPCIGSGLDRLSWEKVKCLILDIFCETNVDITVCKL